MRRITTARFGRIYPEVFAMIDRGDLSLTVASLAAKSIESLKQKHTVADSIAEELLTKLKRTSKSQAEKILVSLGAQETPTSAREIIRPLPLENPENEVLLRENSNTTKMIVLKKKVTFRRKRSEASTEQQMVNARTSIQSQDAAVPRENICR